MQLVQFSVVHLSLSIGECHLKIFKMLKQTEFLFGQIIKLIQLPPDLVNKMRNERKMQNE